MTIEWRFVAVGFYGCYSGNCTIYYPMAPVGDAENINIGGTTRITVTISLVFQSRLISCTTSEIAIGLSPSSLV